MFSFLSVLSVFNIVCLILGFMFLLRYFFGILMCKFLMFFVKLFEKCLIGWLIDVELFVFKLEIVFNK